MSNRDVTNSQLAQFGADLELFSLVLQGWAERAKRLELYGVEGPLQEAAKAASAWGRGLQEEVGADA